MSFPPSPAPTGAPYGGPPPGDPEKPTSIVAAVGLMWVGAALSLIGIALTFLFTDEVREEIERQDTGLSASEVDTAVTIGIIFGVAIGLVAVGLWVMNAVFSSKGHGWARIVASVLYGFNLVFSLIGLAQPAPAMSRISSLVGLLVATGAVIALWMPDSSRFFKESEQARRGY